VVGHHLVLRAGGLAVGFATFLPLYMLRAMGAGDVKLMAAVGIAAHARIELVCQLARELAPVAQAQFLAVATSRLAPVALVLLAPVLLPLLTAAIYLVAGWGPRTAWLSTGSAVVVLAAVITLAAHSRKFCINATPAFA
jgi:hypothetical protein